MASDSCTRDSAGSRSKDFAIKVNESIDNISAKEWQACLHGSARQAGDGCFDRQNPTLSHAFLRCLEQSGCVSDRSGWLPHHLTLHDPLGRVLACTPAYVKSHSFGEYVFDHGWADAFERAGGHYYPKMQISVPFTPTTGGRFLISNQIDVETARHTLISGIETLCHRYGLSSCHITFATQDEQTACKKTGWLARTDQQFHWHNRDYADFDAFLASLSSIKRRHIKRERRIATHGLTIEHLPGGEAKSSDWDFFFSVYQDTGARKWGSPYLNREFFELLGSYMPKQSLLMIAREEGRPVAATLSLIGQNTLYGRYWGAIKDTKFLHFELCYYQAIDFALAHGLKRVEAGAQGAHKLARGYMPTKTYSAHLISHPGLRAAVKEYLEQERMMVEHEISGLSRHGPYRKGAL